MAVSAAAGVGVKMLEGALQRWRVFVAMSLTLLLGGAPRDTQAQTVPRTHLLIISGSSGEPRFAQQFHALAMGLRAVATTKFGVPDSLITYLAEQTTPDPRSITARSTREEITKAFDRIASTATAGDAVMIL